MTEEAIQKMYEFDRRSSTVNAPFMRARWEFCDLAMMTLRRKASILMLQYEAAITVTDSYHETKSCFAWIGEIENERLLAALENLSEDDLKLLTLYVYAGYTDDPRLLKCLGNHKGITIHKRIKRYD